MNKIIAVDAYEANAGNRVGIGRYAFEILINIYALQKKRLEKGIDDGLNFILYMPDIPNQEWPKETSWWKYKVVNPKKLWTFWAFPRALKAESVTPNLVFSPTHYAPRNVTIPKVIALMDLSYLKFPKMFKLTDLYKLVFWTKYSVNHASGIITISENSKNDIIKYYHVDPKKVDVTYFGIIYEKNRK